MKRYAKQRQWNACNEYGFLSTGQGLVYSKQLRKLEKGDIIAAFITGAGYVGIGEVVKEAAPIREFVFNGYTMQQLSLNADILNVKISNQNYVKELPYLKENLFMNADNEKTEWVVGVKWLKTVDRSNANWVSNIGLFSNRNVQCLISGQLDTLGFLEESFGIEFDI